MTPHLLLICVVWGPRHTQLLLSYALRSLLAPDNIPRQAERGDVAIELAIYTLHADYAVIQSAAIVKALQTYIPVRVHTIDTDSAQHWPILYGWAYRHAILSRAPEHPYISTVYPDVIYSNGYFDAITRRMLRGEDIVLEHGIRTVLETVRPMLAQELHESNPIILAPRDLVRVALSHLHPHFQKLLWDAPRTLDWPSLLLFRVPGRGLILNSVHPNPAIFRADPSVLPRLSPEESIDGGSMIATLIRMGARVGYVQDTDECVHLELSPQEYLPHAIQPHPASVLSVARWLTKNTNHEQRAHLNHPVYVHAESLSDDWQIASDESKKLIERICAWCDMLENTESAVQDLNRFADHLTLEGAQLALERQETAPHRFTTALGLLFSGQADLAERMLISLIQARSNHGILDYPDPLELTWLTISQICLGNIEVAMANFAQMPASQHPELMRLEWILEYLTKRRILPDPDRCPPTHETRPSRYAVAPRSLPDWIHLISGLLRLHNQEALAQTLGGYFEREPGK